MQMVSLNSSELGTEFCIVLTNLTHIKSDSRTLKDG